MSLTFDPLREAEELREQLGSDKRRLILFFGAGTSQAVGIDSVLSLTTNVRPELNSAQRAHFDRILGARAGSHIEHVLNHVRLCRELIDSSNTKSADGFDGDDARDMDRAICRAIYKRVKVDPPGGFGIHANVAAWMNSIQRARPVEIFSTNSRSTPSRSGAKRFSPIVGGENSLLTSRGADATRLIHILI